MNGSIYVEWRKNSFLAFNRTMASAGPRAVQERDSSEYKRGTRRSINGEHKRKKGNKDEEQTKYKEKRLSGEKPKLLTTRVGQ